ncbi:hypothetical protein BUALT_Bualt03G0100400 [Buddleja alternifolia]|uniref:RNase H type-1 domain-containing protein n=1 Tax=Buddleja alternifolia TaxID=168488 RepID=A0AAV6XZW6_9LAMI|nr:hypothetical protein BUALT_Bualt03G0100400 [Buddleja alternifolia]
MQQQPVPFPVDQRFNQCRWIFGGYLNHVEETFGAISHDIDSSLREALRVGFETYMSAMPGRPATGYIDILEQLHNLSICRELLRKPWDIEFLHILREKNRCADSLAKLGQEANGKCQVWSNHREEVEGLVNEEMNLQM